jgi:hypothetical protein
LIREDDGKVLRCSNCHEKKLSHPRQCNKPPCLEFKNCKEQFYEGHLGEKKRLEEAIKIIKDWKDLVKKSEKCRKEEIKNTFYFGPNEENETKLDLDARFIFIFNFNFFDFNFLVKKKSLDITTQFSNEMKSRKDEAKRRKIENEPPQRIKELTYEEQIELSKKILEEAKRIEEIFKTCSVEKSINELGEEVVINQIKAMSKRKRRDNISLDSKSINNFILID